MAPDIFALPHRAKYFLLHDASFLASERQYKDWQCSIVPEAHSPFNDGDDLDLDDQLADLPAVFF